MAASPDGKLVAALGEQQGLRIWEVATGKEVHRDEQPLAGAAVAFAPDGKTVVYSFADKDGNKLRWFDTVAGKPTASVDGLLERLGTLAFAPDGKTLAAAGTGNTIRFFDAATGKERDAAAGHAGAMTTIGISPDGKFVVTCSVNDNFVRLWDAQTGREVAGSKATRPASMRCSIRPTAGTSRPPRSSTPFMFGKRRRAS